MDSKPLVAPVNRWRTFWQFRVLGFLSHPLPRTHWTCYGLEDRAEHFVIWKQWGNRIWDTADFVIDPAARQGRLLP